MNQWIWIILESAGGFAVIWAGSGLMVDGVKRLAVNLGIPAVIISFTLVAFGTSVPELMVGIEAGIIGQISISAGNIASSQLINGLLLLGIAGLPRPVNVKEHISLKQAVFMAGATLLFGIFIAAGSLTRIHGVILLAGFTAYVIMMIRYIRGHMKKKGAIEGIPREDLPEEPGKPAINALKAVFGIAILLAGGRLLLDGAAKFAGATGMMSGLVGFFIVTLGTTAPEIISSVVALKKRRVDILMGCAVGSAVFNPLFISGISAVINTGKPELEAGPLMGILTAAAGLLAGIQLIAFKKLGKIFGITAILYFVLAVTAIYLF